MLGGVNGWRRTGDGARPRSHTEMARATRKRPAEKGNVPRSLQEGCNWLLRELDGGPRLVTEVRRGAEKRGISQKLLLRAAQNLPIIRRPRELRGPWIWRLPGPDELVWVRYDCPLAGCSKSLEGWMEFGKSRRLFALGIVRYLVRARVWRIRPGEERSERLRLRTAFEQG